MNRIYKVVWCHVRNTYVVASELASRKKLKSSTRSSTYQVGAALTLASILSISGSFAVAELELGYSDDGSVAIEHSESSQAIGYDSLAAEGESVASGQSSEVLGVASSATDSDQVVILSDDGKQIILNPNMIDGDSQGEYKSIVLGVGASVPKVMNGAGVLTANTSSVVLGNGAVADGAGAVSIGDKSRATFNSVAIGKDARALDDESNMVLIGNNARGAGRGAFALGWYTHANGSNSMALGTSAQADGSAAVAIGAYSVASASTSFALGASAIADGQSSLAIGRESKSTGKVSTAIGYLANTEGDSSIAIGRNALALADYSIAIGYKSVANNRNEISFGSDGTNGEDDKAFTSKLVNISEGTISKDSKDAINGSQLYATNQKVEGIERNITTITITQGNSLKGIEDAFGGEAKFDAEGNLTMPNYKDALSADKDLNSVYDGFEYVNSKLTGITAGAAGLIKLSDSGDVLVVDNVLAKSAMKFDISNVNDQGETVDRTLTGVDKGIADNDAVNVAQLEEVDTKVDGNTTLINNQGDQITTITTKQDNSLKGIEDAFGGEAKFDAEGNLTMPNYKDALSADKDLNSVNDGFEYVGGKLAEHDQSITNIDNSIKTIDNSVTEITSGKAGLVQLDDDKIVIDNKIAAGANTFDISNVDEDRTLTGVAKGAADNDAVNVAQLKEVDMKVDGNTTLINNQGDQITTITTKQDNSLKGIEDAFGGEAKFDAEGNLTMPNYKDALSADKDLNSVYDGFEYVNGKLTGVTDGTAGLIKLADDKKSLVVDNSLASEATSFDFSNNGIDRTLTGVAKGAADNDAVNISQLKAVTEGLGGGSTVNPDTGEVTGPTYNITNKDGDIIVHNNVAGALEEIDNSVTNITNKTGQSLTGIEEALGGGAAFDKDGKLTMPNYKDALSADRDLNSVNDGFEYVGDKLTDHSNQITNIDNRVTKTEGDITNITSGKAGLVQLSDDNNTIVIDNKLANEANTFDISNNGTNRKLDGVANGRIGKDSAEAVNGGQLYNAGMYIVDSLGAGAVYNVAKGTFSGLNFKKALAAEEDIETVEDGFAYLRDNMQSFEDGEAGLLRLDDKGNIVFSDKAKDRVFNISNGDDARALTGVKAGAVTETSLDAINGSQLYATNKSIVDSLGGGAELNDDGSIKGPTYVINGDDYNNVGDAITNIDGRVIDNTKNITNLTENINNINTGKAGLVMIDGDRIVFDSSIAGNRTFDISNNGQARKMTGVADGTIAAGSKDAVNGGQLHETNQNVATNSDNISKTTDALGGGAGIDKDGNYKGPNYSFTDGSNHTNVGSALDNLDGRVNDLDSKVDGIANGTEGLVKLETDENGNQKLVIDNNLASKADTFDISNGEDGRTLTGVNDGKVAEGSKDAINGGQLHDSNKTIADIFGGGATVDADGYVSMPNYDFGDKNVFDNVGDSLAHLNNKIQNGEGGLFQMSADGKTVVLGDAAKEATSVNMGNRVIAGVANGKVEKDSLEAVNGGQLWETNQQVSSNTNQIKHINNTLNHYNTRINNLEKTVHENRKRASAGTASAMAMSSIPYLDYAKYSFGMGVASYDGEAAMSMGLEFKMGDNGRFRIQGSYDTQNKAGVGVGMAFEL